MSENLSERIESVLKIAREVVLFCEDTPPGKYFSCPEHVRRKINALENLAHELEQLEELHEINIALRSAFNMALKTSCFDGTSGSIEDALFYLQEGRFSILLSELPTERSKRICRLCRKVENIKIEE